MLPKEVEFIYFEDGLGGYVGISLWADKTVTLNSNSVTLNEEQVEQLTRSLIALTQQETS